MRLLQRDEASVTFELERREREVLIFLLRRYPVLDPGWHRIAAPSESERWAAEQEMLTEAMTAAQRENRSRLKRFIAAQLAPPSAEEVDEAAAAPRAVRLTLEEVEWLLQMINDVRVGSWVRLGCPEESAMHTPDLAARGMTEYTAMEIGGLVQSILLTVLDHDGEDGEDDEDQGDAGQGDLPETR